MKFSTVAAILATAAPLVAATGYQAAWTITGSACDGQIKLGEYTANPGTCSPVDCKPIAGVTNFSTKSTCVESHITGANEVLKADSYVLVEVFNQTSNCTGDFNIAMAVTADGTCIPSTNGKASYNVTWAAETGAVWLQYATGDCTGEETRVPFPPAATDGKTCTGGFLKALAVAPTSSTGSTGGAGDVTTAPVTTTTPVTSSDAPATTTPAPTTSLASTSLLSVGAATVFAIATAVLA